jgi:RNA polymerase sigma factor (sigma-70 family)
MSNHEITTIARLLSEPMEYVDSIAFADRRVKKKIFDDAPTVTRPDTAWYHPLMDGRATETTKTTRSHVLTRQEERFLFLQYNYARRRILRLRRLIGDRLPLIAEARELLCWGKILDSRHEIIAESNLALVLAMAKRCQLNERDYADLVAEGNMALLRSINKFDCDRGFKFSTYACRSILKAFSRQGQKITRYRQRFPVEYDADFERSDHKEVSRLRDFQESAVELRHLVDANAAALSEVERTVLDHRFGLNESRVAWTRQPTLEQVGKRIGLTKERVRQIQNKALVKLRELIEEMRDRRILSPALN